MSDVLLKLNEEISEIEDVEDFLKVATRILLARWRARDESSEIAFRVSRFPFFHVEIFFSHFFIKDNS